MRRGRTRRPRDAGVFTFTDKLQGEITIGSVFIPTKIAIDPADDTVPEWKAVVALDAWLATGAVVLNWNHNSGNFFEGHEVAGGSNPVVLDGQDGRPPPFLIENGDTFVGEWIRAEIVEAVGATFLGVAWSVHTVPV